MNNNYISKILLVTILAVAMAFVESAVVVYLRAIFYPEGFSFPLKAMVDYTDGFKLEDKVFEVRVELGYEAVIISSVVYRIISSECCGDII